MGDIFDFWFEWKHVVPKGYIRLFGKIAELSDKGINFHFFIGNHDMWMFSYFEKELGATIYRKDIIKILHNKTLYLSHGDGLGPGDYGYKFIKSIFRNTFAQWLYARFHPNFAVWLALFFSRKSRYSNQIKNNKNKQRENELISRQLTFATEILKKQNIDYFILGHQHSAVSKKISETSTMFNIGNWIDDFTYLKLENGEIKECKYE
jgi:UDP-2,3-diacylglucosamine hydrolase